MLYLSAERVNNFTRLWLTCQDLVGKVVCMKESEKRLAALGRKRARAQQAIRSISAELPNALRAALDDGIEKKRAAELAHISRPTLDAMLKEKDR